MSLQKNMKEIVTTEMNEVTGELVKMLRVEEKSGDEENQEIFPALEDSSDDFEWPEIQTEDVSKTIGRTPVRKQNSEARGKRKSNVQEPKFKSVRSSKKTQEAENLAQSCSDKIVEEFIVPVGMNVEKVLPMYLFKADLKKGLRENSDLILWRREEDHLLQKFERVHNQTKLQNEIEFISTNNYAIWQDGYDQDFLEIKAKFVGESSDRVQILNADGIEGVCMKEKLGMPKKRRISLKKQD